LKKSTKQEEPMPTHDDILDKAYQEFELNQLSKRRTDANMQKILNETKLQLKSSFSKYRDLEPCVFEVPDYFVVYAKLHFTKPTYRKLKFLSDLYDEPFITTITDMVENELRGELDNLEELGDRIRQRILEEAYCLGSEFPSDRKSKLETAMEEEKTCAAKASARPLS